jgi:hypothetical protein
MRLMSEQHYRRLATLIPEKIKRNKIYPILNYAGVDERKFDVWLGNKIVLTIFGGLIGAIVPWVLARFVSWLDFSNIPLMLLASLGFGFMFATVTAATIYMQIYYAMEGRAAVVDSMLPDFLSLVAANINAGMTSFSAFRNAARKEFGILADEIQLAATKSLGTQSFNQALIELSNRIASRQLKEIVSFFNQAMRSGGHISTLLESIAMDIRQTQEMKRELKTETKMYVMFVAFVVIIGAPLLLAVSIQFLTMIKSIQEQVNLEGIGDTSVSFLMSEMVLTPEFMETVALILIIGNGFLASIFIGMLAEGKFMMGVKYFPVVAILSYGVLRVCMVLLSSFLAIT